MRPAHFWAGLTVLPGLDQVGGVLQGAGEGAVAEVRSRSCRTVDGAGVSAW